MKTILIFIIIPIASLVTTAQDLITKTDGTIIKGKVVSFQENRLIIQQDDETEIIMPRKAISIIRFNYSDNNVEIQQEMPKAESLPVAAASVTATAAPQQIKSPAPIVTSKNVIESIGEVSKLDNRKLLSAPALKNKPLNSGIVTVNICVNTEGVVTSAKFKAAGSSTLDTDLISLAVENAKEFRFTKGKGEDCGLVMYKFNLD